MSDQHYPTFADLPDLDPGQEEMTPAQIAAFCDKFHIDANLVTEKMQEYHAPPPVTFNPAEHHARSPAP